MSPKFPMHTPDSCDMCIDDTGEPQRLFIHARCHLTAPLQASLEDDVLTLRCYLPDCQRIVAVFRVSQA